MQMLYVVNDMQQRLYHRLLLTGWKQNVAIGHGYVIHSVRNYLYKILTLTFLLNRWWQFI